jgi:hypothetical protein
MSTSLGREAAPRVTPVQALLACGVLYSLTYAITNDVIAATSYSGYSRMSQAVSELSATGAPTRTFLKAMAPIGTLLIMAFGIGVWKSARGKRALRVTGGLLIAHGVTGLLWLPFPMTSREEMINGTVPANDVGHIVLTAVTVLLIVSEIGFAAAAFGWRFRIYSILTAATVLVFGALTGIESPKVPAGDPTPWMGFYERVSVYAWLLWVAVLAIILLRTQARAEPPTVTSPAPAG